MRSKTSAVKIQFDSEVFDRIQKEASLNAQTVSEFMENAVLEKLEDSLDYQDALQRIKESNGKSLCADEVKRELKLDSSEEIVK
ncbi:DUF6290 family protein [Erysipelotrichaceae bacterium 51-3]